MNIQLAGWRARFVVNFPWFKTQQQRFAIWCQQPEREEEIKAYLWVDRWSDS